MNSRLQQFLSAENITQAQFADSINVARAGVSHIIAGRNKPSWDFLLNTMNRYPDLNIEWLMTGKGKMYKSPARPDDQAPVETSVRSDSSAATQAVPSAIDENSLFEFDALTELNTYMERLPANARHGIVLPKPGQVPNPAPSDVDTPLPSQNQLLTNENKAVQAESKMEKTPGTAPFRQRKVTKVIIFFDDGTFQER
ncbi:MAG: helix-turn-helix transcriptional regulator [Bacteroidales bacterium]|nr:helix-turn-helix transcriptional regulator [Bacteroidales bacterium]